MAINAAAAAVTSVTVKSGLGDGEALRSCLDGAAMRNGAMWGFSRCRPSVEGAKSKDDRNRGPLEFDCLGSLSVRPGSSSLAGVAAVALVAVVITQNPVGTYEPPSTTVADMEILLGEDSIEMFEELEFYSWIDVAELQDDVS